MARRGQLDAPGRVQAAQGLLTTRQLQGAAAVAEPELAAHAACHLRAARAANLRQQDLQGRNRRRSGKGRSDAMLIQHAQGMPQQTLICLVNCPLWGMGREREVLNAVLNV